MDSKHLEKWRKWERTVQDPGCSWAVAPPCRQAAARRAPQHSRAAPGGEAALHFQMRLTERAHSRASISKSYLADVCASFFSHKITFIFWQISPPLLILLTPLLLPLLLLCLFVNAVGDSDTNYRALCPHTLCCQNNHIIHPRLHCISFFTCNSDPASPIASTHLEVTALWQALRTGWGDVTVILQQLLAVSQMWIFMLSCFYFNLISLR